MSLAVMNIVDALAPGGTERMAINIVNHLPQERYRAILCTTRDDGALSASVAPHVVRLRVHRRTMYDNALALQQLVRFIRQNDVRILHAHSSTLFIARAAAAVAGRVRVIWHAHWGRMAHSRGSASLPYRVASFGVRAAVAANEDLKRWIAARFPIPKEHIYYVPNIAVPIADSDRDLHLPGVPGKRIVCVANIRPEKDHLTLIRAMAILCRRDADAHLILAGVPLVPDCIERLRATVVELGLTRQVTYLGYRGDTSQIMRACDIGVLSSVSEGLPVALLEYGMAGLPVVTTPVGQCGEVVEGGKAGLIASAGSPVELADALAHLLSDSTLRKTLSERFHRHVNATYGPDVVINLLGSIYDSVLLN